MCAPPGSRVYGTPSAKLAWYAAARPAGPVPRSVFWPVPNVDSRLVAFTRRDPPATAASREEVFAVVDAAFAQRRKTLRAALSGWAGSAPRGRTAAAGGRRRPGCPRRVARGRGVRAAGRVAPLNTTGRTAYDLTIVTGVTVRVPAKLNLQLAVGPPRADGYHDLVTVFHAVSLFDEITAEPARRNGVSVSGEGADRVPADGDNLALRAVAALRAEVPSAPGVHITIAKRIPVAAGPGRRQRRRGRGAGRLQRALGRRFRPAAAGRDRRAGGQRRGLRAARRDRGGPRPGRAADARAGPGDPVPLGARLRRRAPVHARGVRGAGPAAGPRARDRSRPDPGSTPRSCRRCARAMPGWSAGR